MVVVFRNVLTRDCCQAKPVAPVVELKLPVSKANESTEPPGPTPRTQEQAELASQMHKFVPRSEANASSEPLVPRLVVSKAADASTEPPGPTPRTQEQAELASQMHKFINRYGE